MPTVALEPGVSLKAQALCMAHAQQFDAARFDMRHGGEEDQCVAIGRRLGANGVAERCAATGAIVGDDGLAQGLGE